MPTSLPQAAPVSRHGMKSPLGTLNPYVHVANTKYTMKKQTNCDWTVRAYKR